MCGAELHALPEGVQRVARALQDAGHSHAPLMLDGAARTAQEAADGLGVQLGQIAKSVIFRRKQDLKRLTGAPLADVAQSEPQPSGANA